MSKSRRTLYLLAFLIGAYGNFAQVLFARESIVVFGGNELNIGFTLAGWLAGVFIGAMCSRLFLRKERGPEALRKAQLTVLISGSVLLPLQIFLFRSARKFTGVLPGEYVPAGKALLGSFLFMMPSSLMVGFAFPLMCELLRLLSPKPDSGEKSAGSVYVLEALGSMAGGAVLTFLFLPFVNSAGIFFLIFCIGAAASVFLLKSFLIRTVSGVVLLFAVCIAVIPNRLIDIAERGLSRVRWRDFGVLKGDAKLIVDKNSRYQNLTVIETDGQFVLYANGIASSVFPDANSFEHKVHFLMAQKPDAQSILLLGGNPVGDLPEYLKYGAGRIVFVELDSALHAVYKTVCEEDYGRAVSDPRVGIVVADAQRYVARCAEKFSMVIVDAPPPTGMGSNRFYVRGFFQSVAHLLEPGGIMCITVPSAVHLRSEVVDFAGSILKTLQSVFPVVAVTAGESHTFFCGDSSSGITLDRHDLKKRSEACTFAAEFFRPEYFLASESINPAYVSTALERLERSSAPMNTVSRPVAYYYNLALWSRYSGSGLEKALHFAERRGRVLIWTILAVVLPCVLAGGWFIRATDGAAVLRKRWIRAMLLSALAVTGFTGLAAEMVAIFILQSLYGYVYSVMGLFFAIFMLGLVTGGLFGRKLAGSQTSFVRWFSIIILQCGLTVIPLILWCVANVENWHSMGKGYYMGGAFILITVAITGGLVGAQFPLVSRLLYDTGGRWGGAVSLADAFDHLGAAIGAALTGVLLVPMLGIGQSCVFLSFVALGGATLQGSALLVVPSLLFSQRK